MFRITTNHSANVHWFECKLFRVLIEIMSELSLGLVGNVSDGTYCWPLKIVNSWTHIRGIGIIFVIQVG